MNNNLKELATQLGKIADNLVSSISFEEDIIIFAENKIQTAISLLENAEFFVENNKLNRIDFVRKGIIVYNQTITHFAALCATTPSPNINYMYYKYSLIHEIFGLISIFENIENISNEKKPKISIFKIQNFTSINILIEYPPFSKKENEIALAKIRGGVTACYPYEEKSMYIHTNKGVNCLDISRYNDGDIYEVGIDIDELGNFKLFPCPLFCD